MQLAWLARGLRTGVLTTRYPRETETLPAGFRGRPVLDAARCRAADGCDACSRACLPGAITCIEGAGGREPQLRLNYGACIMCGLCAAVCPAGAMTMTADYELAVRRGEDLVVTAVLRKGADDAGSGAPTAGR